MTVGELIAELKKLDPKMRVLAFDEDRLEGVEPLLLPNYMDETQKQPCLMIQCGPDQ
jgi:hypothetical protein